MSVATLAMTEELYGYLLSTTVREPEVLARLRRETAALPSGGMQISPELREGLGWTMTLAIISSLGQVIVPITVQQTLDRGLHGSHGEELPVTDLPARKLWLQLLSGAVGAACYGLLLRRFTNAYSPFLDSTVLAFSIVVTKSSYPPPFITTRSALDRRSWVRASAS